MKRASDESKCKQIQAHPSKSKPKSKPNPSPTQANPSPIHANAIINNNNNIIYCNISCNALSYTSPGCTIAALIEDSALASH